MGARWGATNPVEGAVAALVRFAPLRICDIVWSFFKRFYIRNYVSIRYYLFTFNIYLLCN